MKKRLLLFILVFISIFSTTFASVEMINNFDTTVKFNSDNTLSISKHISIQNIHTVGIVPGRVKFKINKIDSSIDFIDNSLKVTNKYGSKVKHQLIKTKNYYIIAVDIYTPILPGFKYDLNLDYKLHFSPSGILFKSVQVPLKENIDAQIKSGTFKLILEDNKRFTYLSFKDKNTIINKNQVTYKINKDTPNTLEFEYSLMPIDIFNFKGSYVFWITVNLLLIILLIIELRKELDPFKKRKNKLKN